MTKCKSVKVNMYKMKYFAFYTLPFWVNLSHFRIIQKNAQVHQCQSTNCNYQTSWFLSLCRYL